MNKRITSIVLCLVLLVSLMAAAVPVSAESVVALTVKADKTEANVGDTITYTIAINAVEDLGGLVFELAIPEGLTFVAGSSAVNADLKASMDFGEASFAEATKVFVGVSNESSTVPANTVLMTFKCTVDEGASGDLTIGMLVLDDDVFDGEMNNIPHTESVDTVTIGGGAPVPPPASASVDFTVKADAATANPGDTITFEVSVAPVDNVGGIVFTLNIPEGLSFVAGSSSVNAALKGSMNFGEASFAESTLIFVGVSNEFSNIAADTVLMTFKCTVDAAASGSKTVTLDVLADDVFDADLNNIPFTVTAAIVSVEAAGCAHDWAAADCDTPKTCKICGETEGSALGHDWAAADCDTPKTCNTCGATEGSALGHSWDSADCTTAKTCSVCGLTEGAAAGHDWAEATCTAPKTCSVCGATEGDALGHDWADADCQNPKTCTVCGATEGEKGDHVDADNDGKCDICGYEKTPETGDVSVMGFVVVLMLALACGTALVCGKKKFIA